MFSLVSRYLMSIYLLLLLLIILIKENYSRIIAEYLYSLTVKSTILRPLTKCHIYHTYVVNSQHVRVLDFLVDVVTIVCLLHI